MVLGWGKRAAAPAAAEADSTPDNAAVMSSAADAGASSSSAEGGHDNALNLSAEGWADDSCDGEGGSSAHYDDGDEYDDGGGGGPASSSMGGAGYAYHDHHGNGTDGGGGGDPYGGATPPLFPSLASAGGVGGELNYPPAGGTGWPPPTMGPPDKSKKMKRDRGGGGQGGAFGGGSSGGGGNVTRIDVYPNGESYVTHPDGTTAHQSASSAPAPASPIFQFTSNTAAAASGGGMVGYGGGGSQATPTPGGVPPQTAAAALDFGKGFAPGAGAQGIAPAPPPLAGSSSLPPSVSADPLDGNYSHEGGDDSAAAPAMIDAGDTSTTLTSPPLPWRPQTTTSTCEFTHTIANYAQKRDSGCKKAEYSAITTDPQGNKWRLIIYVNGNGRASNHHLSLFLQVADAEELPFGWNKAVSYVLTLEHPQGQSLGYAKRNPDKTFKLCPKAIDWGWSQFITSDRIQQEGYVDHNALTVRASVTVKSSSVQIDPEDAELYLKCAVEEGNAAAVRQCLAREARVNCQFKDDLYTPLHTACSANNHGESTGGCSSSPTNSNSASPGPISEGSLEVLDLLLDRGADVNACNKWRETPLLIAANNGHVEAVRRLLRTGADPSLCSEAGWSALTFAAHKGYDDICGLLLDAHAPVNCRVTEDLSTPLHKACAGSKPGHVSAVQQLLEGDADVHALNKWRETPLLTAANHGQHEAVEALLAYGADPCKCTDTGWSPLSIAAYKGHDECVRLLLEDGAPTEEDDPTLSALLQAATKGLPDTCMLLLRHGADHTVTTKKGDTALSILVEQNLIDAAVEMATDYGASVPRCSRDRKKVQRARLLINLRLKQMQKEGTGPYCDDSDQGESDSEPENGTGRALHDDADSTGAASPDVSSKSKKKKGKQSIAKAEAEARAAEEALLLELEAEEAKTATKGEGGGGSSKNRKKKLKKKERERKEKEEKERLAREEAEEKERKKKEKEAAAALAAAEVSKKSKKESPSPPAKKEKVVELSSQTVAQKKKSAVASPSAKGAGHAMEVSLPSPSSAAVDKKMAAMKKAAAAETKLNLKWAENKDAKPKKVREVSLPSAKSEKKTSPSTVSNHGHGKHGKTAHQTGKGAGKKIPGDNPVQPRKIPGDNPVQPRKIPGDNPVQTRKIPGDNPIQTRKIPGDNPVQTRRIPGDNPKVPVQQSRAGAHPKGATPAAKSKRGWESKSPAAQPATAPAPAPQVASQKKQPKQQQAAVVGQAAKEKPSGKKATGSGKKSSPADMPSPPGKGKAQQHPARSDESTQSTANSTADSLPPTPTPGKSAAAPTPSATAPSNVDDQLANMANDVLGFLDFDPSQAAKGNKAMAPAAPARSSVSPSSSTDAQGASSSTAAAPASPSPVSSISVELPSVSIFRLEKINELFRQRSEASSSTSNPLRVIDERTLRVVLYRWIIRASHGAEPFLDPIIPSWEDGNYLKQFLQRQFISESRRSSSSEARSIPSIEVFRDAGAAMSEICTSLARDVVDFREKCEQQVPSDWTDTHINVAGMEEGSNVIIDWSGKSRLAIPYVVFNSLARRYAGDRNRLMSAVFSAVRRHEIMTAIADQTDMICHLPLQAKEILTKGLSASLETWSDSITVYGDSYFCAMFPDIDASFGGLQPFGKDKGGGESVLERAGGSVVVVAPPENATASQCVRKLVDMSETSANVPLSFGVVLSSDCFVNANSAASLSVEDLRALDPRLCGEKKGLISFVEIIPAGSCSFSKSSSMFLLVQNEVGKMRFPAHPAAINMIRGSMRTDVDVGMASNAPMASPNLPGIPAEGFSSAAFPPASPVPQHYAAAPQGATVSSNPWGSDGGNGASNQQGGRGHRGRLFELVGEEDGAEEDQNIDSLLPGMLDSLDMNMFGGNNTNNGDVDIEAISLMGFGMNQGNSGQGQGSGW